jgi:hypothetical protein
MIYSVLKGGPWDGRTVGHANHDVIRVHDPVPLSEIKDGGKLDMPPMHVYEPKEGVFTFTHTTKALYRR